MRMISQKAPFPKVAKRLGGGGSGQQEKEQRGRQKGKCGVLPGAHTGHCKLTAWLPTFPVKRRLPHFLWPRPLRFQVRLE